MSETRKPAPQIPDKAEFDLKLGDTPEQKSITLQDPASASDSVQPEPPTFSQQIDLSKLLYGQKLIGWSIFLFVTLTLIAFFFPAGTTEGRTALNSALELLKLVTTTAIGFVFARHQFISPKQEKGRE